MIKIYYVPAPAITREYLLIKQGLVNNPRVELVDNEKESDFVFQFYHVTKHIYPFKIRKFPPHKTIFIDYHDSHSWISPIKCLAYFKRSWVKMVVRENYTIKKSIPRLSNFYPLMVAIMDEAIIDENLERDIVLSCTLRTHLGRLNRKRVLEFVKGMNIQGKTQIGELNKESARGFNAPLMKDYWKLLRKSRIVVTCNPSKWEGDHRTWDAFANGALVFIDRMYTPMVHPLIDGKHCIFYDLSDDGLKELRKKIRSALLNPEIAANIAKEGHEFTMKYHRASNRIDEILERIL